jgi:hypothetical protein
MTSVQAMSIHVLMGGPISLQARQQTPSNAGMGRKQDHALQQRRSIAATADKGNHQPNLELAAKAA